MAKEEVKFTLTPLIQATGLYYYGARYYDPRTSVWQSPDPILGDYLNGGPNGGVMNPANLGLYGYTFNNPVNLVDPDGLAPLTKDMLLGFFETNNPSMSKGQLQNYVGHSFEDVVRRSLGMKPGVRTDSKYRSRQTKGDFNAFHPDGMGDILFDPEGKLVAAQPGIVAISSLEKFILSNSTLLPKLPERTLPLI